MIRSGVYPCEVIARSSEEPIVSDGLTYTVRVYTPDGASDWYGVKPQEYDRVYYAALGIMLVPFDVGMRMSCTVIRDGGNESLDLSRGEIPAATPCGGGP